MTNCDKQREQLIHCMRQTECFKSGKTVKQCVKEEDVGECQVSCCSANESSERLTATLGSRRLC